jgi:hypothetical protein
VTPSAGEDPLDPHASAAALHEARAALLFAARAVKRAWLLAFGSTLVLALAAAGLFAVSLYVSPTYILIWTVLLSAALYNVTRYWPQRDDAPGVSLQADEVRALRHALDPHAPVWPGSVQLVPDPEVTVRGRHLTLGMPVLACLGVDDLGRLVTLASRAAATAEDDPVVRRALTLADADIGSGAHLRRRASARPRGLSGRIQTALVDFRIEHDRWLQAFRENAESSSNRDALSLHHRDLVAEGWQLMGKEWLEPSLERGRWHGEPFTSLREFLAGAETAGILDGALPPRPERGPLVDLVTRYEDAVADLHLGERRADDLRVIGWGHHPTEVTVPSWRVIVDEALDASRQLSGVATPPTVEGVLGLVESGDLVAVARHVAPSHGYDDETTDWATMSRWVGGYPNLLLIAVVGMAALDSGRFRPRWSWPDGTSLVNADGWVLPLHQIADEVLRPRPQGGTSAVAELSVALRELGVDVTEPLWLTSETPGAAPTERPQGSFVAYQGLGSRQVIVTDRAMHVFGRPWAAGLRDHYALRMRGAEELRTRMLRVWQGDETDQTVVVPGADVRKARFSILTGGSRWRLRLYTDAERVTLRGFGDGRAQEAVAADWLGDRLTTAWLHSPAELLMIRNVVGRVGLALGIPALLSALVLTWWRPGGLADSTPPLIAVAGVAALLVAVVPDVVMELIWKVRGPAERPGSVVPVRRYARTAPSAAATPHIATDPLGRPTSALDAITLDLGDLPRLADWDDLSLDDLDLPEGWDDDLDGDLPSWPAEIVDLADLPDLPDLPRA